VRRRPAEHPDRVRLELTWFARASVATIVAVVVAATAALLIMRRWVDLWMTLAATAALIALAIVILAQPEALVISRAEVRDESGWRRRGWRIRREDVALVRWEDDPDIFEPPRLTFLGHHGEVLRAVTVEFDPPEVLGTLRRFGWPLED
jgi:hypothetical protein